MLHPFVGRVNDDNARRVLEQRGVVREGRDDQVVGLLCNVRTVIAVFCDGDESLADFRMYISQLPLSVKNEHTRQRKSSVTLKQSSELHIHAFNIVPLCILPCPGSWKHRIPSNASGDGYNCLPATMPFGLWSMTIAKDIVKECS